MRQYDTFDKLTLEYHSGPIPPPFCHRYKIEVKRTADTDSQIALDLEYFDREELSEEEIYDEGFTPDDNFKWEGQLPDIWIEEISSKLGKTNWKKKPSSHTDGSEFIIKLNNKNQSELLQPADIDIWQVFCQEIVQAVFELAKKEAPLCITFVDQTSGKNSAQMEIEMSFSNRCVTVNSNNKVIQEISWDDGQKMLKHIFSIDYYPENSLENISGKKGMFIDPGDGLWYQLDPSQHKDQSTQQKIRKLTALLQKLP